MKKPVSGIILLPQPWTILYLPWVRDERLEWGHRWTTRHNEKLEGSYLERRQDLSSIEAFLQGYVVQTTSHQVSGLKARLLCGDRLLVDQLWVIDIPRYA